PNNKKKSVKEIKASDRAHPKSRKAIQMRRSIQREGKVVSQKASRINERNRACKKILYIIFFINFQQVERIMWFRFAIPDEVEAASTQELHDTIVMFVMLFKHNSFLFLNCYRYINRHEEEINELMKNVRPGRPRPPQLDMLEALKRKDSNEYATGFEVPDITDPTQLQILRNSQGDYNSVNGRVKLIRLRNPDSIVREEEMERAKLRSEEGTQLDLLAKMRTISGTGFHTELNSSTNTSQKLDKKLKLLKTESKFEKKVMDSVARKRSNLSKSNSKNEKDSSKMEIE
ncbi:hypothetical protein HK096_009052, partial [Nowakowskiella sp. JEL0078]